MADRDESEGQLRAEHAELRREVVRPPSGCGRSEEEVIAETMARLSREIHGGIAQDLAALNMRLSVWRYLVGDDPERAAAEIEELKALVATDVRKLKQLIFILRPVPVDDGDLYDAIEAFLSDFAEQNGLQLETHVTGAKVELGPEVGRIILRMLQECLHNIERHAAAQHIQVDLDVEQPDRVVLTVWDDGAGFDPAHLSETSETRYLGLRRLRERMESLGGVLSVKSAPGDGTTVEATLPLVALEKEA